MCPRHQFIWPAAIVNRGSSVPVVTVQPLVALRLTILRADHPYNRVIGPIGRRNERRPATIIVPFHVPAAANPRRIGWGNADSLERAWDGAKSDIRTLVCPISCCCL